ncbi:MAG: DUF4189 domain-containing protein [Pseudomonadota bacterium]
MFETGSRDFIGCAPIPGYGESSDEGYDDYDSSYSSGPSGPQYAESSMATAIHLDTSAVWGTAGHRSPDAAKKRVMDACAAAMGEGCIYSEAWTGDVVIAVAVDGGGEAWPEGAATKGEAEKEALATCQKNAGAWGCKIVSSFENVLIPASADSSKNYAKDYFPQSPIKRRHWALLAQPDAPPSAAWQRKTWMVSGKNNFQAAKRAVVDRCQADTGASCTFGIGVPNGTLVHYINKRGQSAWVNAAGVATPAARMDEFCKPDEKPCRILAQYDAATPRLQVVADPDPTRGYVSVAWPTKMGWNRLAIVTGRPTVAQANKDALALCERESKVTCELYLDNPDNRNSMFLGLYSLPKDQLHIVFGFSIDDVKKRAAEASAKNNLAYTNLVFVDLHERQEITPLYKK